METTYDFDIMAGSLKKKHIRVAVAIPEDEHTVEVVTKCLKDGIADFILVADDNCRKTTEKICSEYPEHAAMLIAGDVAEAAAMAVKTVRDGNADVLMKGMVNTDILLKAVLDKTNGLLIPGQVMSHATAALIPGYDKMILFTDAAVIPRPDTEQFDAMVKYTTDIFHKMNGEDVKAYVALIHCTEKTNGKFPHTLSYEEIKQRATAGRYGKADVDGPMDVKTACDTESGRIKGIESNVAGKADILIFPNIEAGNTFYKTITLFGKAKTAGILCGVSAPVVVSSRADSAESKYYSLIMACAIA